MVALLTIGVGTAAGQTSSTVQFQSSYRAWNVWDDWQWWLPDKCTLTQQIYGSEPSAQGRYPVLLYLHGYVADTLGNLEGQRVAELAASQGFVAAAFTYESSVVWSTAAADKNARCMFDPDSNGNALANVCARPKADCSRGVVVAGFSSGGAIAARAANFSPQVRAGWLLGVNGPAVPEALAPPAGSRALPNNRIRISVGRSDIDGNDLTALNMLTGRSCSASPCLGPDGSGYYVVEHSEVADGVADHCWWQSVNLVVPTNSCTSPPTFDPGFPPPGTAPWSLTTNLDWLRAALEAAGDSDSLPSPPPKDFSFGKVKRNKRKGTAKLTVRVPGPGGLELAKSKRVKGDEQTAEGGGREKLSVKSRRGALKRLNAQGEVKVNAKVTYTPTGGSPNTEDKKIKLVKR